MSFKQIDLIFYFNITKVEHLNILMIGEILNMNQYIMNHGKLPLLLTTNLEH